MRAGAAAALDTGQLDRRLLDRLAATGAALGAVEHEPGPAAERYEIGVEALQRLEATKPAPPAARAARAALAPAEPPLAERPLAEPADGDAQLLVGRLPTAAPAMWPVAA